MTHLTILTNMSRELGKRPNYHTPAQAASVPGRHATGDSPVCFRSLSMSTRPVSPPSCAWPCPCRTQASLHCAPCQCPQAQRMRSAAQQVVSRPPSHVACPPPSQVACPPLCVRRMPPTPIRRDRFECKLPLLSSIATADYRRVRRHQTRPSTPRTLRGPWHLPS